MAYLVLAALSALSTAIAVLITVALFRIAGPKRTRLIAQIIAAIVGAGFVIGIQAVAILHFGNMFALRAVQPMPSSSPRCPTLDSLVWAPAQGRARRLAGAARPRRARRRRACRHHRLRRLGLRPPRHRRRRRRPAAHRAAPRRRQLPPAQPEAAAARQGMEAPRARSVAAQPDADADPLSGAAGAASCGSATARPPAPMSSSSRCW